MAVFSNIKFVYKDLLLQILKKINTDLIVFKLFLETTMGHRQESIVKVREKRYRLLLLFIIKNY